MLSNPCNWAPTAEKAVSVGMTAAVAAAVATAVTAAAAAAMFHEPCPGASAASDASSCSEADGHLVAYSSVPQSQKRAAAATT